MRHLCFSLLLVFALITIPLYSQGIPTESKGMDLAAFGGYLNANPAYVPSPAYPNDRNSGTFFGADLTRYFHLPVAPSLEVRANFADGAIVDEHSYLGGLRVQGDLFHRYHPYADFLAGYGSIHFNHPTIPGYTHDNSTVYSYGGGLDVDLMRHFQARVDFQGQRWALGTDGPNDKFSPSILSIGLRYVIPFKPHVSQQYAHQ
jgi:hypothetical protein